MSAAKVKWISTNCLTVICFSFPPRVHRSILLSLGVCECSHILFSILHYKFHARRPCPDGLSDAVHVSHLYHATAAYRWSFTLRRNVPLINAHKFHSYDRWLLKFIFLHIYILSFHNAYDFWRIMWHWMLIIHLWSHQYITIPNIFK